MRNEYQARPAVESLESLMLLSAAPHALPKPLHLVGVEHGSYVIQGGNTVSRASGTISPLGAVSDGAVVGKTTGLGTVSMTTKEGRLVIGLRLRPAGSGFAGTYFIAAGTSLLAGETGTGTVKILPVEKGTHGTYTISYS